MIDLIWYSALIYTIFFWIVNCNFWVHNYLQKYEFNKIFPKTGFVYSGLVSTAIALGGLFV